ncbi:AAA family ATPase [uncultured Sphingomonas sp.]|uniref:AAA family ATPase n=1 Tax=uncultured Sphingomonas sp. TaxID=158754 RepID=UPI0025FFD3B9|nr:AAA family ATPase [uncultured Sphingomonas sp.]
MVNLFSKAQPNDVFTPRSREINERMYVDRPELEERLEDALKGDKYIIVHGESGNGKTWLYKRVLTHKSVRFEIVNLANAVLHGSLLSAFEAKLAELGIETPTQRTEEFDFGVRPGGIGGGGKQQTQVALATQSAFSGLVTYLNNKAHGKRSVLVLDNFEQIVDDTDYLRAVASIIISADEESIAKHGVKLLLVGVPRDLKQLVAKVGNASTIANRLIEIPEVARLTLDEAISLMSRGFEKELRCEFTLDKVFLYKEICWKTDRIAQQIHELCLKIALEAQRDNNIISLDVVSRAERKWLEESFTSDLAVIENLMNSIETKVGRKNQVIYSLGKVDKEDFKHSDIERIVREEFDVDEGINLNLPQMLASFSKAENPLIRRTPKNNAYRFVSPKLKMAIRAGLQLDAEHRVVKIVE